MQTDINAKITSKSGSESPDAARLTNAQSRSKDLRAVGEVHTPHFDESVTREEFRAIKRHILSRLNSKGADEKISDRTILVTSASPGEGKTTVTLGLAMSFMFERDWRVVLIDADMRSKELSRRTGLEEDLGLLDYLEGRDIPIGDVIYPTNVSGVFVVPAGKPRINAPELVGGEKMAVFLDAILVDDARTIVLIDSGSVLACSETVALAQHVGHTIFVVAKGETKKLDIDEGLGVLHRQAGPVNEDRVSIVFNKTNRSQSPVRYAVR